MTEEAAKYNAGSVKELVDLIRNDAYAASFQSMGQYRRALLEVAADHIADVGKKVLPAGLGEAVGEVRLELGIPSYVYGELYSEAVPHLAPGAKLYVELQPAKQRPFEWPLLDAPALIDGVIVGKGCSSGHVVMIAKRKYQYAVETSPEEHAQREKAFKDVLVQIHEGSTHGAPEDLWVEQEEQQPAPDVSGLVEALEQVLNGGPLHTEFWNQCEQFVATHRKGGEA